MPITINWFSIYGTVSLLVHILGIANAAHAVMNVRVLLEVRSPGQSL